MGSRRSLHRLRDSEFALLDDPARGSTTPNLTNAILPIFGRDKFKGLSNTEYRSLDPALRLASRLLLDDRAAQYITTIMDGSLHSIDENDRLSPEIDVFLLCSITLENVRLVRCPRPVSGGTGFWVDDTMRVRSREILQNLAGYLEEFVCSEEGTESSWTTLSGAVASAETLATFPYGPDRQFEIHLGHTTTWTSLRYPKNSKLALGFHFGLASSLVHEVAHVLSRATHDWRPEDVFFYNSSCNEAGYNLETVLFGGVTSIDNLIAYLTPDLVVDPPSGPAVPLRIEYPSRKFVTLYAGVQRPVGLRQIPDRFRVVTRIPWAFLASMFTEAFWPMSYGPFDPGPIQPENLCKWVFYDVKVGDRYVSEAGRTMIAENARTVPCSLLDISLPLRVQRELRRIVSQQRRGISVVIREPRTI